MAIVEVPIRPWAYLAIHSKGGNSKIANFKILSFCRIDSRLKGNWRWGVQIWLSVELSLLLQIHVFWVCVIQWSKVMVWIIWTLKIACEILGSIFPCLTMINGFIRWKASLTIHQWSTLYGAQTTWHVHVVVLNQYCRFSLCWECHALVNVFIGNALHIGKHTSRAWSGTEIQSKSDHISWTLHSMVRNREFNSATWMDKSKFSSQFQYTRK